jgi:hypothetical protein
VRASDDAGDNKEFARCLVKGSPTVSEGTIALSCECFGQTMPVGGSQLAVAVLGSNKQIIGSRSH